MKLKAIKMLLCRHDWENERELDWYGKMLIERSFFKCRKCGKTFEGKWRQIGGCK